MACALARRRCRLVALFGIEDGHARGDARAQPFGHVGFVEAAGQGARNQGRRQLALRRQQPGAARHRPLAARIVFFVELAEDARAYVLTPVVEFFLECVLENLALFFHHQDLFETSGELACVLRIQRPDTTDFHQTYAQLSTSLVVQPQLDQCLARIQVRLAGRHNAKAWLG